jgi:hypothetical protein
MKFLILKNAAPTRGTVLVRADQIICVGKFSGDEWTDIVLLNDARVQVLETPDEIVITLFKLLEHI